MTARTHTDTHARTFPPSKQTTRALLNEGQVEQKQPSKHFGPLSIWNVTNVGASNRKEKQMT